ncbi:hypothetical protein [Aliiroseovarius lamellibrachiae]|uniref:hypothetical protein n=1 Tax=Aliiroseovarius lamellibrachiae TaxID=1924933 RepID=UPI001BE08055|nr:hypothetical protein [Aliiroseovarius lamellibrachiae]MBT2130104.1 hypothetical protein [Aliiroseovarius lamellibrachiae]
MGRRLYTNIEVRGVTYKDANAAAKALGVTADAVRIAVRKGTTHRIGTGAVGAEPMPVQVRGKVFGSAREAAAQFGGTPAGVYRAINDGRAQEFKKPLRYNGATSKPISIGSLSFTSMEEANRTLGFGRGYIAKALRRQSKSAMQKILGAAMRYAAQKGVSAP